MSNNSKGLFIGPGFKKWFIISTVSTSLIWTLITFILYLCGNNVLVSTTSQIFAYYNAVIIILTILSLILDEKIRKYPGLLSTICMSLFNFCYIFLCAIRGDFSSRGVILAACYFFYIGCAFLIYKFIIPLIIVKKRGLQIFNFIYLMIILNVTIVLGFLC